MATKFSGPITFESARDYLGSKTSRSIAPNTVLSLNQGIYQIHLHGNLIMDVSESGAIRIYDGNQHFTKTTKARINSYMPKGFWVYTERGDHILATPKGKARFSSGMDIFATPATLQARINPGRGESFPGFSFANF